MGDKIGSGAPRLSWQWPALLLILFASLLVLGPGGFQGGGNDDWHYVQAARCWIENGPCLPRNHWQGRWPLVAPIAGSMSVFGESRWSAGLPALAAALLALFLAARIGNRLFGSPAGWIAALMLAATPVVVISALVPNVDIIELALLLGALAAILEIRRRPSLAAVLAGLAAGLAFQVRETAAATLPLLLIATFVAAPPAARLRPLAFFAAGFVAPLALELLVYWIWAGDPLWRRQLSVAHTTIPSTELPVPTAQGQSPFFNLELIEGWSRHMGIHVHWLVDGLLNLVVDWDTGFLLLLAPAAWLAAAPRAPERHKRIAAGLLGGALFVALLLIFALSIDPLPRMMLVPIAASALVLGYAMTSLWMQRRFALPLLAGAILAGSAVMGILLYPRWWLVDRTAEKWLRAFPEQVEIGEKTRRNLALQADAQALPPLGSGKPLVLILTSSRCSEPIADSATLRDNVSVERGAPLGRFVDWIPRPTPAMCLLRYRGPRAPAAVARAVRAKETALTR